MSEQDDIKYGAQVNAIFKETSKKELPLVSIITIVRNGEKTIERAIQSVLNQTYKNIEYIIIDGASTDGTLGVIKKYAEQVDYWVSEPDEGISDAFNKGIRRSHGELIGILNCDDWYEKNTVYDVVMAYVEDLSVGVVHGNMRLYQDENPIFIKFPDKDQKKISYLMIYNHSTCFVARRCYNKFGLFDKNFKVAMDYDILLRFYINGVKFHYVEKILSNMAYCGASDKFEIKGLIEIMRARNKYKYNVHAAAFWSMVIVKIFKRFIRKILGRENPLLKYIRSFSKDKKVIWGR